MSDSDIKLTALDTDDTGADLLTSLFGVQSSSPRLTLVSSETAASSKAMLQRGSLVVNDPFGEIWGQAPVSAHDVASLILSKMGPMTAMKLQKLAYYCQAWSLVWDEAPLFHEDIEAWANGPVVRELYRQHQGMFKVAGWYGDQSRMTDSQRDTVAKVLEFYGAMSSQQLSDLTHNEMPWRKARAGLQPGERGCRVISHADMAEYYSSL